VSKKIDHQKRVIVPNLLALHALRRSPAGSDPGNSHHENWWLAQHIRTLRHCDHCASIIILGAGRGGRTPTTLRSADFESAASASSAIPAWSRSILIEVTACGAMNSQTFGDRNASLPLLILRAF
jgi:hypothetical protein